VLGLDDVAGPLDLDDVADAFDLVDAPCLEDIADALCLDDDDELGLEEPPEANADDGFCLALVPGRLAEDMIDDDNLF